MNMTNPANLKTARFDMVPPADVGDWQAMTRAVP
jgi:hypothetical protein